MVASRCKRRRPNARSTFVFFRTLNHSVRACSTRVFLGNCTKDETANFHHLPRGQSLLWEVQVNDIVGTADLEASWASTQGSQARLQPHLGCFRAGRTQEAVVSDLDPIHARLIIDFPNDLEMRVSHETIYTSLYLQAKGGLEEGADLSASFGKTPTSSTQAG